LDEKAIWTWQSNFFLGGFVTWSDEELKTKFEMHFDPEEIENA